MAMAESPATALRRYQTDLRKLIRGGFNRYADCKKCWVVWTDDGRRETSAHPRQRAS